MIDTQVVDCRDVADAVALIRETEQRRPDIALILGSGLSHLADAAERSSVFKTSDLPGYPVSTVKGHSGRLVVGELEGKTTLFVQGRVHPYEGYDARQAAFPVRLAFGLGARRLVVTNAAGGANPTFGPGTIMFIEDHISFGFDSPLTGPNNDGGPRFPDMSEPYDKQWLDRARQISVERKIPTKTGVYLWTLGPSYETKAEVQAFYRMGADAIGMSTVPEVIQARYLAMNVLGISTITNPAAGLSSEPLDHDDVLKVSAGIRESIGRLVRAIVADL